MAKKKMYTFVQDFVNGEPPAWKRADQRAERRADRKARMINAVTETRNTARAERAFANATKRASRRLAQKTKKASPATATNPTALNTASIAQRNNATQYQRKQNAMQKRLTTQGMKPAAQKAIQNGGQLTAQKNNISAMRKQRTRDMYKNALRKLGR